MNKITYTLFFLLSIFLLSAQQNNHINEIAAEPEMADMFRSEGKIYVVIAVLSIIFICLIWYLIYIDMKLKKLENQIKQSNTTLK